MRSGGTGAKSDERVDVGAPAARPRSRPPGAPGSPGRRAARASPTRARAAARRQRRIAASCEPWPHSIGVGGMRSASTSPSAQRRSSWWTATSAAAAGARRAAARARGACRTGRGRRPSCRLALQPVILLLHHRYRHAGGEERAVEDLRWLIREHLHEDVEVLERDSERVGAPAGRASGCWPAGCGRTRSPTARARDRRAGRARPQRQPDVRAAGAGGRQGGGRPRRPAPAQLPARVRGRHVLHAGRGLHALPRPQHAPRPQAQLPRRLAGRVRRLRRRARAAPAAPGRRGRRDRRPVRVRAPAAAGPRRAARRQGRGARLGPADVRDARRRAATASTSSPPGA